MKKFGEFMRSALDVAVSVSIIAGMAGVAMIGYSAVTSKE